MDKRKMSKKSLLYIIGTVVLISLFSMKFFVIDVIVVEGDSMRNTYTDGDLLWLWRPVRNIERYDVVTFYCGNKQLIKRVVGLPGESIRICDGKVYINDVGIEDSFGLEPIQDGGIAKDVITLGESEYFVLGDNRNNSKDSRDPDVGVVLSNEIRGKIITR